MLIGQHQKNDSISYIYAVQFEAIDSNSVKIIYEDSNNQSPYCYIRIKFEKQSNSQNIQIYATDALENEGIQIDSFALGQKNLTSTVYYRDIIIDKTLINNPKVFYIKIIGVSGTIVQCSSILNILPIATANNIGIWGSPSQIACVNGVKIQLGRTGIYELNNPNIKINFVGFVPIKNKNFVLDYAYE